MTVHEVAFSSDGETVRGDLYLPEGEGPFPAIVMELFRYGQARDEAWGVPLQERVTRINKCISGPYGPSGVKTAMNLAGLIGGRPRRPLLPLTPAQVEAMRNVLVEEGLLS